MLGDSELENLSFVNLRFITFISLYFSFARYEEVCNLTLRDIEQEESGFVLNFYKGKSYQFGESNIGKVSNIPNFSFKPARVFSIYLDPVAALHTRSKYCYTRPNLGISAQLKILVISACEMGPRSGIIITRIHPASQPSPYLGIPNKTYILQIILKF
jgi:hypothetical protein